MAAKESLEVSGHEVSLSNLKKLMFPKASFSKADLINYYIQVSPYILPHIKNRPLTFKRFPDGINGDFFYEKNAPAHTPSWVKRVAVPRSDGSKIHYVLVNDTATLVWAANLANIEIHTFLSAAPKLAVPRSIVFDLDPGPGMDVLSCAELALYIKQLLKKLKFDLFMKASGSKGMQLYIPLNTKTSFEMTARFAKTLAVRLESEMPGTVVSKMSKSLRKNKIFIDWSQNSQSKTTVSVYSLRAKSDEPFVSFPFDETELKAALRRGDADSLYLGPDEALKRLKKEGDSFSELLTIKRRLSEKDITALAEGSIPKTSGSKKKAASAGALKEYRRKRDLSKTPEPASSTKASPDGPIFVIQKHDASHLHFDFRLEMEGVLKSWAVPKGPPLSGGERRLAMEVEDHPLDYAQFEGIIPPGNYGAGTVLVWDQGSYEVVGKLSGIAALKKGKLEVRLHGEKLEGRWILVRDRREDRRWLMIKGSDGNVKAKGRKLDLSVLSKRTLKQIETGDAKVWKSNRPARKTRARKRKA